MPVQYRSFYLKKLSNTKEQEKRQIDAASGKNDAPSQSQVVRGPQVTKK
jgi:hypothetical protein